MMKSIVRRIFITDDRPDMDAACRNAYEQAIKRFGIDEDGHAADKQFDRSSSSLVVRFVRFEQRGGMGGLKCLYEFDAWMEKEEE